MYDRHQLHRRLPELLLKSNIGTPLAFLLLAPADFFLWQETLSPLATDALLEHMGEQLKQILPPGAELGRWDYATFALFLPASTQAQAEIWIENCRGFFAQATLPSIFALPGLPLTLLAVAQTTPPVAPERLLIDGEILLQREKQGSFPLVLSQSDPKGLLKLAENWLLFSDPYLRRHSQRTAALAEQVAQKLGWDDAARTELSLAAALADLAMEECAGSALRKPGSLTQSEYRRIREHPQRAAAVAKTLELPRSVQETIHYHHERRDGSGYPGGLKGDEIPAAASLLGICSAYAAMELPRPYRPARSLFRIREELTQGAERYWPRKLVQALFF